MTKKLWNDVCQNIAGRIRIYSAKRQAKKIDQVFGKVFGSEQLDTAIEAGLLDSALTLANKKLDWDRGLREYEWETPNTKISIWENDSLEIIVKILDEARRQSVTIKQDGITVLRLYAMNDWRYIQKNRGYIKPGDWMHTVTTKAADMRYSEAQNKRAKRPTQSLTLKAG